MFTNCNERITKQSNGTLHQVIIRCASLFDNFSADTGGDVGWLGMLQPSHPRTKCACQPVSLSCGVAVLRWYARTFGALRGWKPIACGGGQGGIPLFLVTWLGPTPWSRSCLWFDGLVKLRQLHNHRNDRPSSTRPEEALPLPLFPFCTRRSAISPARILGFSGALAS